MSARNVLTAVPGLTPCTQKLKHVLVKLPGINAKVVLNLFNPLAPSRQARDSMVTHSVLVCFYAGDNESLPFKVNVGIRFDIKNPGFSRECANFLQTFTCVQNLM